MGLKENSSNIGQKMAEPECGSIDTSLVSFKDAQQIMPELDSKILHEFPVNDLSARYVYIYDEFLDLNQEHKQLQTRHGQLHTKYGKLQKKILAIAEETVSQTRARQR